MKMKTTLASILTVACLLGFVGCKNKTSSTNAPSAVDATDGHGHEHADGEEHALNEGHGAGPHDGTVADWGGGKYHVEFTVDHDKQEAAVYILGSDETTPMPIEATEIELSVTDPAMQVTLKAAPREGDPAGKASRFIGNHEKLGVVQEYAGTISGVVDGTPYSGDFTEEPHGGHDH